MRIALVGPHPGPATGSRAYAARLGGLLPARHTVRWIDSPDQHADGEVVHLLDAKHALGAPRPRGPLVVDLHDAYWTGEPDYPAFDRALRRFRWSRLRPRMEALLADADSVIVHAACLEHAVPHDRVVVVPIPAEGTPQEPPDAHTDFRVLFAGRDGLRKGLPVLGRALRKLGLPATLTVAGREFPHLRAAQRWWTRRIVTRFPGELTPAGMDAAYAWADVVALPSYTEAFGMVAQEALCRGVPVVASDVGGLGEFLRDLPGAWLAPPGNPVALAEALDAVHRAGPAARDAARDGGARLRATRTPKATLDALDLAYDLARKARKARA